MQNAAVGAGVARRGAGRGACRSARGIALTPADRLRRAVIEQIMCRFAVDLRGGRRAARRRSRQPDGCRAGVAGDGARRAGALGWLCRSRSPTRPAVRARCRRRVRHLPRSGVGRHSPQARFMTTNMNGDTLDATDRLCRVCGGRRWRASHSAHLVRARISCRTRRPSAAAPSFPGARSAGRAAGARRSIPTDAFGRLLTALRSAAHHAAFADEVRAAAVDRHADGDVACAHPAAGRAASIPTAPLRWSPH